MSDFTPDEMQTLRVAMRLYMESMRTNAITFKDDPDISAYFASEAVTAEGLWNKMVQMDLESIRAVRKALADALMDEARAEVSSYYPDTSSEELNTLQRESEDTDYTMIQTLRGNWVRVLKSDLSPDDYQVLYTSPKRQYNDRPMHGPF